MSKKMIVIFLIIICLSGCQSNKNIAEEEKAIPIKVKEIKLEEKNEILSYIGIIQSEQVKKYSFKSGGKIEDINVIVGQYVEKGYELISLDKTDLEYQTKAAKNQMDAAYAGYEKALNGAQDEDIKTAELNVKKAQSAYEFSLKNHEDMKELFEEGAVSESQLKEAELNYEVVQNELEQAKEQYDKAVSGSRNEDIEIAKSQYNAAKNAYDAQKELLDNATIFSDVNGYIVDILYEEGEMIGAGYPAIVVQSEMQVVNVGISQKDIEKITEGTKAIIKLNNNEYEGIVNNISQIPDLDSRTYSVEIVLKDTEDKLYIGSTAKVQFVLGKQKGIWIEIPYILSDGQDYVYICEDDRATRKNITLGSIYEDKVYVKGLKESELLIIKGTENLKEGYKVIITN